MFYNILTYFR